MQLETYYAESVKTINGKTYILPLIYGKRFILKYEKSQYIFCDGEFEPILYTIIKRYDKLPSNTTLLKHLDDYLRDNKKNFNTID
jgi:hypothetical protein